MNERAPVEVGIGGDGLQPVTAADVAEAVGGKLLGDGTTQLTGVAPLDRADPHSLSFFAHERYAAWYAATRAGAVLVSPALADAAGSPLARIVVEKPTDAMVQLLARFYRPEPRFTGVHPTAVIGDNVKLGEGVTVDPLAVIADGVHIGDGTWIGAGASIGAYSTLGVNVRVHANATVHQRVEIGDRVVLHSGSRVGREGFGFIPRDGGLMRIPHVGRCVIEHDVEVGANSCIDRGSVDDTIIGAGTKIDNLVHIAHNVRVGRMCFIIAQVGIAGSTRIGDGVQIGGQAGLGGHISVGARASIGAQAGVFGNVPAGETWSGYPARPHREQLRASAALYRVAKIIRPLEALLTNTMQDKTTQDDGQ